MRGLNLCPVVLAAWLAGADSLQAGVYLLEPVPSLLPPLYQPGWVPFENVRRERENLRDADDRLHPPGSPPPAPGTYRLYYQNLAARLDKQRKGGFFSARNAVTLSGCLLRLGKHGDAASCADEALHRLSPRDPVRFLLLLNLACAYQEQNDFQLLQRAIENQREALRSWPALWAGWDQEQWRWQRRVEQLTLKWMRQRLREQIENSRGQPPASVPLDPLFDTAGQKVRFVGPSGYYEAGTLAFEEENKLPRDAENLVIALLLAHPYDNRLWWLYGELLNARGEVKAARDILGGLRREGALQSSELAAHRRVLFADEAGLTLTDPNNQEAPLRKLFWAVAPRGHLFGGGLADATQEAAWLAVISSTQPTTTQSDDTNPPPVGPTPAPADRLPSWRETVIGFAAGVVVGLLAALQWLEWRRRRRQ
jgi:tetratricopeptide (TPR) repeat protein